MNTRNARALEEHLKQARAATKISYFDAMTTAAVNTTASELQGAVASEHAQAEKPVASLN